jgi:hypothetical protein
VSYPKAPSNLVVLPAALAALLLAACGGSPAPEEKPVAETPATEAAAPADDPAAQLAAKEEELKQREAELALKEKEAELAQREAALASKEQAAKKTTSTTKSTASTATTPVKTQPPAAPKPLIVPAGTKLSAELVTPVSTKTNRKGDRIEARVVSDVVVDGKVAVPTGTILSGTVTERVSGSKEIGATPKIAIAFDTMSPDADHAVSMSASLVQTGKSEGGRDTAKIAGGAVAGAVIGHQVDSDKGAVIGGLLGAAAGTAAAKNTGNEVDLPAGTVISVTLDNAVEMKP